MAKTPLQDNDRRNFSAPVEVFSGKIASASRHGIVVPYLISAVPK